MGHYRNNSAYFMDFQSKPEIYWRMGWSVLSQPALRKGMFWLIQFRCLYIAFAPFNL
jgi:hypothetical protein